MALRRTEAADESRKAPAEPLAVAAGRAGIGPSGDRRRVVTDDAAVCPICGDCAARQRGRMDEPQTFDPLVRMEAAVDGNLVALLRRDGRIAR